MKTLGIGIIGTGFMGKAHAFAYRAALAAFPDIPVPSLEASDETGRLARLSTCSIW